MQAHIPQWTKDYTSSNPDHMAAHYEGFLSAIILQTSRVNLVPLKVAAMHKFRVKYAEAHQFASCIATFVSTLRRKAATVTTGKRQSPATLRLLSAFRLKWGEEKLEDEQVSEDPEAAVPEEKETRPANPEPSSGTPSWGEFLKRFDKEVAYASTIASSMHMHTCIASLHTRRQHAVGQLDSVECKPSCYLRLAMHAFSQLSVLNLTHMLACMPMHGHMCVPCKHTLAACMHACSHAYPHAGKQRREESSPSKA